MNRIVVQQVRTTLNTTSALSRRDLPHNLSFSKDQQHSPFTNTRGFHNSSTFHAGPPKPIKEQNSSAGNPKRSSGRPTGGIDDVEIKGVAFSELGATKTVKMVVIVAISIIATVETFTYGTWIYNRWFKKEEEGIEEIKEQ